MQRALPQLRNECVNRTLDRAEKSSNNGFTNQGWHSGQHEGCCIGNHGIHLRNPEATRSFILCFFHTWFSILLSLRKKRCQTTDQPKPIMYFLTNALKNELT